MRYYNHPRSTRRSALYFAGVLLASVYIAVFGGEYNLFDLWLLEREQSEQATILEEIRQDTKVLNEREHLLRTDNTTLEQIARERYGLIRDGERLLRFAAPPPVTPANVAQQQDKNVQRADQRRS